MDTHPNTAYKLLKPNIVSNIVLYISRAPNESSAKLDQCLAHVLLGESTKPTLRVWHGRDALCVPLERRKRRTHDKAIDLAAHRAG